MLKRFQQSAALLLPRRFNKLSRGHVMVRMPIDTWQTRHLFGSSLHFHAFHSCSADGQKKQPATNMSPIDDVHVHAWIQMCRAARFCCWWIGLRCFEYGISAMHAKWTKSSIITIVAQLNRMNVSGGGASFHYTSICDQLSRFFEHCISTTKPANHIIPTLQVSFVWIGFG